MTLPMQQLSPEAQQFNWLLSEFATETPGVVDAIAVSSDGLLIAMSNTLERADADRLAAITSAIVSLAGGAARVYDLGAPAKIVIDLERGFIVVCAISVGSALGVLAAKSTNLGALAYEMAMFANRASSVLSPALIDELKTTVGS